MNLSPSMLKFSIVVASIALGIGITAPTITITPGAGELTALVELLSPGELEPRTYSIARVIQALFDGGDYFLAVALAVFSIIFPIVKLGFYWVSADGGTPGGGWKFLRGIDRLGKFSMAEVFLLALTAFALKDLPGDTMVQIRYGFYVFFAAVLLSLLISACLRRQRNPPESLLPN